MGDLSNSVGLGWAQILLAMAIQQHNRIDFILKVLVGLMNNNKDKGLKVLQILPIAFCHIFNSWEKFLITIC